MTIAMDPELSTALRVFKRFFDVLHRPVTILNSEGYHVYYNKENADLDDEPIEEVLGKHMLEPFPDHILTEENMLEAMRLRKEFVGRRKIYYTVKDKKVDYSFSTVPLYNKNGEVMGAIETGEDISRLDMLNQEIVNLNLQLQALNAGHIAHDLEGRYADGREMVYISRAMQETVENAERLAKQEIPVLVIGETGTGKELLVKHMTRLSSRAEKSFIALNCAALPETLIESALFGSVKGAFTGAETRSGFLELAEGGTLFLDELNCLPLSIQGHLLRFLQEGSYWPVGGTAEKYANVRVIAAMNADPHNMIRENRLRPDLFYRLEVGIVHLPPLRERPEDIMPLTRHFITKHQDLVNGMPPEMTDEVRETLLSLPWPGNIRMLENVIVRSIIAQGPGKEELCSLSLFEGANAPGIPSPTASHTSSQGIPATSPGFMPRRLSIVPDNPDGPYSLAERMASLERSFIVDALVACNGSVASTARRLDISRGALQYKIKKYNITLAVSVRD